MEIIKIGKYIAIKRKEQGITQRQVAEKLGVTDKSVSKWERGICLPDASVYSDLCKILNISISEFFAGEDIPQENLIKKSEENIIGVITDSQQKQTHLARIIGVLLIILLVILMFSAFWFLDNYHIDFTNGWPTIAKYTVEIYRTW